MEQYRFYVPDLLKRAEGGGNGTSGVILPEDQAHHARTVLRLEPGERVVVFDGQGAWAEGELQGAQGRSKAVGRGELHVEITGGIHVDPPPAIMLTIATAVPKGDRAEWLIEQTSQLSAACVQWLDCDRSVVKPREGGQKIEKWRRLAVESAKQCGRTHVMRVEEPGGVAKVVEAGLKRGAQVLWLEPREGGLSRPLSELRRAMGAERVEMVALVGPEGGWSEREWGALEDAALVGAVQRVRLTATVLRIETACAAVAAIVMAAR